jgi:FtsH-binding integral membrane protein
MTDPFFRSGVAGLDRVTLDVGLRAHMQRVFGYMSGGLAVTGLLAWALANSPALTNVIYGTPLRYVAMLLPFAFIIFMSVRASAISAATLKLVFWLYCAAMGLSMGAIFLVYTGESVARSFFITGATFGAMSLWGYTTKRDLTGMGSFLMMGVVGLMIASVINIFLLSSMMQWVVSVAAVAIFTGLTAWDVQRIKQTYAESYGVEANDKLAVFGALSLYLDFINVFFSLLQLTGNRRS